MAKPTPSPVREPASAYGDQNTKNPSGMASIVQRLKNQRLWATIPDKVAQAIWTGASHRRSHPHAVGGEYGHGQGESQQAFQSIDTAPSEPDKPTTRRS